MTIKKEELRKFNKLTHEQICRKLLFLIDDLQTRLEVAEGRLSMHKLKISYLIRKERGEEEK